MQKKTETLSVDVNDWLSGTVFYLRIYSRLHPLAFGARCFIHKEQFRLRTTSHIEVVGKVVFAPLTYRSCSRFLVRAVRSRANPPSMCTTVVLDTSWLDDNEKRDTTKTETREPVFLEL